MKINGNFNSNPMLFAQSPKTAAAHANAAAMQQAMEQAGGPAGGSPGAPITMRSGSGQPPVDVNTILENWGTSNAIADLNVDGIVDAQDLAMVLQAAQDSGNGGSNNSDSEAWNTLVGGDLNGDGVVDAVDLAMKLNAESNGGGDGDGSNNDSSGDGNDAWTTLVGGDLNGDGVVDAVDLAMKLNAESNGGDGSNNDSSDGDGAWNPLGGGSISPVDASKLLEELELDAGSEQMVERLTNLIMKSFDSDGDGVISADNLPQNSKLVSYFDRDSSGLLERNELMKGLAEEFRRATEASDGANPAAFARRWMETFNGVQSIPSYNSPARLQELFLGRVDGQVSLSNQSILSAQA
ncbi:MAG: Dockerin type domain [Planctomycetota bacterium]